MRDPMELLATLADSPDDVASWSVYADLLQSQSEPRGELISMMLQRARQPSLRLFDAQRRYLASHAAALVPDHEPEMVWRHGFVAELRIDEPEGLAALAEPALRFVDTVTLAIDSERWLEWREGLAGRRWPWRHLIVELANPPAELELQVLFACCPALETARIHPPEDDAPELVWQGVCAPALRRLVLVNAGRVEAFDRVELPALRELWLLGASVATESLREQWRSLERVVIANPSEADEEASNVVAYRGRAPVEDDDDNAPPASNAFVIVGQPIDVAVLRKLAARMTGIAQLSVRIADLWWLRRPVTVLQLYGTPDPDSMLPYSLAVALENVLATRPPIVLVELGDTRGQFLALGEHPARGGLQMGDAEPADIARRAFDIAFGCDPGSAILDDVLDALAAAPEHVIVGSTCGERILNVIDPRATPLDTEDDSYIDDEEDEDEDEGYDYEPWEDELERYEEPVPLSRLVVKTDNDAEVAELEAAETVDGDELSRDSDDDETYATDQVLERPEAWFEFREHWDDRASDPDDEPGEARWPDPAVMVSEHVIGAVDRQIAEPACSEHTSPLDTCSWCSTPVCLTCNADAPLEGVCASCLALLDRPLAALDATPSRGRVVS